MAVFLGITVESDKKKVGKEKFCLVVATIVDMLNHWRAEWVGLLLGREDGVRCNKSTRFSVQVSVMITLLISLTKASIKLQAL